MCACVASLLAACGRHATQQDCQLIVDKSVELEMKESGTTDAAAISKRESDVRAALEDRIRACGRDLRVTGKTMTCVRAAQTSKEISDCLR